MDFLDAIHDPLRINLKRQTLRLMSKLPPSSPQIVSLQNAQTKQELLSVLSGLLTEPQFTAIVATLFRPILLDLASRWLDKPVCTEDELVACCYLVEIHEELFPILHHLLHRPPFEKGPLNIVCSGSPIDTIRLHRLLLAYYRILQANRQLPEYLNWSLIPLSTLMWTAGLDNGCRLLAILCYALQSGMGEAERNKIEAEILGPPYEIDCPIWYGESQTDGWVMPVTELRRIKDARNAIAENSEDYYAMDEENMDEQHLLLPSDLSPHIIDVHGILLVRSPAAARQNSNLVCTSSTIRCLQSLALHISLRLPVLLSSSPSSGKSLLLSHLAGLLYPNVTNQIITIHLADTSLDPRSLLGSYVSSSTMPGTFEWKEGALIRAMREGKWVVFEDIDRGSSEVLGTIKPLVESLRLGKWIGGRASLEVPSRGQVVAAHEFAIFATRSVLPSRNGCLPNPTFFGSHKFHEVVVPSPSPDELRMIVDERFPRLAGYPGQALIRLWKAVVDLGSAASMRDIGLRELEKFCRRVEQLLPPSFHPKDNQAQSLPDIFPNTSLREDMYLEARDVFFGAGSITASARAHLDAVANTIADHLGLDTERRTWVLQGRAPDLVVEKDVNGQVTVVRAGRTSLSAHPSKAPLFESPPRPFAMHGPAAHLISRTMRAVAFAEPVLLTGETGTGKTSAITHLANLLRRPLVSLNLSHQTESADLLGGFKPVDARIPGGALQERFLDLFGATFSRKKNAKFEESVRRAVGENNWKRAVALWKEAIRLARDRILARMQEDIPGDTDAPRKRRKIGDGRIDTSENAWVSFEAHVAEFEVQHVHGKGKFAFGFVEGPLVKALRNGDWVLLDEINLASAETLECVSGLLHGPTASITLTEQGSLEPVPRHPDFRLFACMNPATDVGKKDLPPNIRMRFTEIDVPPPDADRETLLSIVTQYIGHVALGDKASIMNVAEFYLAVKHLSETRQIADGANHRPHYSMRTLARALTFAADIAPSYGLRRAIWEGCLMAFTMVLDAPSAELVTDLARKHLLAGVRNPRAMLMNEPSKPQSGAYVKFGPFYLERGPLPEDLVDDYIMTPSVEDKLKDLARIILTRRFPVLIEGPTSSGKTSSVEYLAKRTGHRFVRINNHEHTDIQEYLGSYVSDPATGKLMFKDGLLVQALRKGDWIVLDELNLAPTDVLEALNRLLDDNRELVIPETHEVVKPHPHFMLFATQNPPGLYAGRKVLSRAFRNRFLEVHFDDVPQAELETILCQRCRIAPSYGARIVKVFRELQQRRQSGRVFESKQGFATLRDLFRWAGRDAVGYQELAENGYMLLAERARRPEDKAAVKEVIESVMGVRIDEKALYSLNSGSAEFLGCPIPDSNHLVWTSAMRRLFILIARALRFNEPVLLVGETGSGKTSVCQVYAEVVGKRLHALNCHQNTETADLIGGLRPVRNRSGMEVETLRETADLLERLGLSCDALTSESLLDSVTKSLRSSNQLSPETKEELVLAHQKLVRLASIFEWKDGPLVQAMRSGDVFLLDEISLADDSVLERLNSVLEPARTIVMAERGGDTHEIPIIHAADDFKLVATMNPGGDYGKKELSPALRNRFTEIWVPPVVDRVDLGLIVNSLWKHKSLQPYTEKVLDFTEWLAIRIGDRALTSLRDILAWVNFSNAIYDAAEENLPSAEVFHHAAHMTVIDGLGSLPQLASYSRESIKNIRQECLDQLCSLAPINTSDGAPPRIPAYDSSRFLQIGSFAIPVGSNPPVMQSFNLQTPTTRDNAMRVIRACQVSKPILLEGSPGVGKTSLIVALASMSGHRLCRINLSDQTDLIDLFGSDLPTEGGGPGEFTWKDAEFLTALQEGHWVLLDEMNLAPQAVLEGLNAVLDHRGTVYIPELGRTFTRHPDFRIFAAQNPLSQGGGRKGLPKSFVNRFTKVYVEELTPDDLSLVCELLFSRGDQEVMRAMIAYSATLSSEVSRKRTFAQDGAPWEFNLRDIIRWGLLVYSSENRHPLDFLATIYLHRFRNSSDRDRARLIFDHVFQADSKNVLDIPRLILSAEYMQIGHFHSKRHNFPSSSRPSRFLQSQLAVLETLGHCIKQNWLAIVTGPRNSGKTEVIRLLAHFAGYPLHEVSVNSATDTMDLLGSFEQMDECARLLAKSRAFLTRLEFHVRLKGGSSGPVLTCFESLRLAILTAQPTSFASLKAISLLLSEADVDETLDTDRQALIAELNQLSPKNQTGRFEWVDGPLVRAAKEGHWLLIEGANLCSPSVLDRLNSLCEANGVLTLSERGHVNGSVQTIQPHHDFRLFMSVDPQHGELSRAMRNRGVEVAMVPQSIPNDERIILDYLRLPDSASNGDLGTLCVSYDAIRRGISCRRFRTPDLVASSGCALDHNSSLCSFLDQGPLVEISQHDRHVPSEAMLHFHARTTTPAHHSVYTRVLTSMNLRHHPVFASMSSFTENPLSLQTTLVVETLRKVYMLAWNIPLDFVITLSIDALLNYLPEARRSASKEEHTYLFQLLDLVVVLFLDEQENQMLSVAQIPAEESSPLGSRACKEVLTVLSSASEAIRNVIAEMDLSQATPGRGRVFTTAHDILRYTRRLRRAISSAVFDYSAVQAISKWLSDLLSDCLPAFFTLRESVQRLIDAMTLSSGVGLSDIWAAFFSSGPSKDTLAVIQRLDTSAATFGHGSRLYDLRRSAFDIMALYALSPRPTSDNIDSLAQRLNMLAEEVDSAPILSSLSSSTIVPELSVLTSLHEPGAKAMDTIGDILNIAYGEAHCSIRRLIPYQHLHWADKENQASLGLIARLHLGWHRNLWEASFGDRVASNPSALFRPVLLCSTFSSCVWTRNSLLTLPGYEVALDRQAKLILLELKNNRTRLDQLTRLLCSSLLLICSCFPLSYDPAILVELGRLAHSSMHLNIDKFLLLILRTRNTSLATALERLISPAFTRLWTSISHADCRRATVAALGSCWVSLARLIIDLYVPDAPIDPLFVRNFSHILSQEDKDLLQVQLVLHEQLETFTAMESSSTVKSYLRDRLDKIATPHDFFGEPPSQGAARDPARLQMFWSEVAQFRRNVITTVKIDSLVKELGSGEEGSASREDVVQQSIAGFCQRLDTAYPDFSDLAVGVQLALENMRFGLSLTRHSAACVPDEASSLTEALVAFPSVRSLDIISRHTPPVSLSGFPASRFILLSLAALGADTASGVETDTAAIDSRYSQALHLWLIDRAKDSEADKAAQSLYRQKTDDLNGVSEVEAEEEEFVSLFPSFEDVFERITACDAQTPKPSYHINNVDIFKLVDIHHSIITPAPDPAVSFDTFSEIRRSALESILRSNPTSLQETLDGDSAMLQLLLVQMEKSTLQTAIVARSTYNFYANPNVPEVIKGRDAMHSLIGRLDELLNEWPDQMVLHELKRRCEAALELELQSPLAKILSALEQILLQTEDWEIYAGRETTLREHQHTLASIIVAWRRLELSSWPGLLDSELKASSERCSEWWFRLYNGLVRGLADVVNNTTCGETDPVAAYLRELVPLLDDFIRASPLGQFQPRMHLLRSFELLIERLAECASEAAHKSSLMRVNRIVHNTHLYFNIFSHSISGYLSQQRATLEKEILAIIKLASWRDINVQALKQSARRSHHQLYKIIRKFRDLLREPIASRLIPDMTGGLAEDPLDSQPPNSPALLAPASSSFPSLPVSSHPLHLVELERTFARYRSLIESHIHRRIQNLSPIGVEDFATEIITTANELSSASIGGTHDPLARQKHLKALLVRKRKAWADLLKELKRVGFASTVKQKVLQQQADIEWVREQPVLQSSKISATSHCDKYFSRLSGSLPALRSSAIHPHSDINMRELQRGMMFVEFGFSLAVDARQRLAQILPAYDNLGRLIERLKMLSSCPKIVCFGAQNIAPLKSLRTRMLKLTGALNELASAIKVLLDEDNSSGILSECLDRLEAMSKVTKDHQDRILILANDVDLTTNQVLLEPELDVIVQALRHLQDVASALREWSELDSSGRRLFMGTHQWLDSQPALQIPVNSSSSPLPEDCSSIIINAMLVTVQEIIAKHPRALDGQEGGEDDRDNYIREDYGAIQSLTTLLDLENMVARLEGTLAQLASMSPDACLKNVQRVLPFAQVYERLVEAQLRALTQWAKALFKLDHVLVSVMNSLVTQGFCKPPDMEDSGQEGESSTELGGVGFGEGSGSENVSKEIEEEHQVEGLQGDETNDSDARDQTDDSNAIEMSEDVGGEMQDVPDAESDDEGSGSESDEGPDEKLGNLDKSDPAAVDEKLWGDEKGPESNEADDKVNQERSEEKSTDSEVVAKEGPQSTKGDKKEKDTNEHSSEADAADEEPIVEENQESEDAADDPDAEPPSAQGAPMNDHVQDADTLDLPDDLEMNVDDKEEDGMEVDDSAEVGEDVEGMEETLDYDPEEPDHTETKLPEDPAGGDDAPADGEENAGMELSKDDESAQPDAPENEAVGTADISAGDGVANTDQTMGAGEGEANSVKDALQAQSHSGHDASQADSDQAQSMQPPSQSEPHTQPETNDSSNAGSATVGNQRGPAPSETNTQSNNNPLRSLADTLDDIRYRLEPILDAAANDSTHERVGDIGVGSQFEYLQPGEEDHDMQALGPAGEEEVAKLKDLKLVDEENEQPLAPMDVDPTSEQLTSDPLNDRQSFPGDRTASNPDLESAVTGSGRLDSQQGSGKNDAPNQPNQPSVPTSDNDDAPDDAFVEKTLREWQSAHQPEQAGEKIWHLYESLTSDLAHALCEQLRLILEPTLATRLRGDYRTGKRLNMKKIIPYIASDYTKDKIWLRRTRPSQREYQVLIALDDSRSMAESHSVHLAFQTLALVSKALSRLEAGDMGIARFGETVDFLHGFDEGPFSEQAGTKVVNSFKFDQKSTNVLSLLQRSLQALEAARERRSMSSGTAADLWQLEIIISDGICQDHEQLRTALRKAEEQRVMIVFIIIDSLHPAGSATPGSGVAAPSSTDSILSMPRAVSKLVNGRMEVELERYLDSFPFEYYVVLRNVEALPDVLAGTLKQFFERISEE